MSPPNPLAPPNLRGRRTVGVDVGPAGPIIVPVLFSRWLPSIAAFEEGAGCGARQWHRGGAPGGAGSYVTGPARPKRQPLVTGTCRGAPRTPDLGSGPAAIRGWRLPALHSPFGETEKGKRRAGPGARIQSQGSWSLGQMRRGGPMRTCAASVLFTLPRRGKAIAYASPQVVRSLPLK